MIAFVSKPPSQRSTAAKHVRVRTAQVKAEREKLQQIFNNRFPGYMSLSRPQPLHAFAAGKRDRDETVREGPPLWLPALLLQAAA